MSLSFKLEDVKELANQFAANHLDSYLSELKSSSPPIIFARKEINDALWGTIGLTPIEVALLDSPLIQRLRYIRQLGVVHWVYPGAIHTRFDHALGVLHQVQHLTSALNALGDQSRPQLIKPSLVQLLRLSALLHDIGHASFSHVSEIVVHSLPSVSQIPAEFSKMLRCEPRKLSEIFAYFIVKSPSMHQLMHYLFDVCGNPIVIDQDKYRNINAVIDMISKSIIGVKIDDRVPLLHEIISGPFDADKLDYFVRDARLAGIPTILDITRLVQKLAIRELASADLPREIASHVQSTEERHFIFGVKWSGVALLDELQLARVLLYAKIYRHPKVIAIEQMVRSVVLTIGSVANIQNVIWLFYSYPDDVLLNMDSTSFAKALQINFETIDSSAKERLIQAADIIRAIRNRRLWVRAFGLFQRKYLSDPLESNHNQKNGLIQFREELEHPQEGEVFRQLLLDEVHSILICLADPPFSRTQLESQVMIHMLSQIPGSSQISRAYLMPPTGKPVPFRDYHVNRGAWADSYLSDQPAGFILCPPQIADAVYLGVEKLIRIRHNVKLPPSAIEVSKRDQQRIQDMKQALHKCRYYQGVPYDIRPIPTRLKLADADQIIKRFARILASYQEPTTAEPAERTNFEPEDRVFEWLRQFDNDDHIECALRMIDCFRMLTRDDTTNALKQFIELNPKFRGARVIPFGSAKDSAAISTYFAADVVGTYISECTTLSDAAKAASKRPIIFIDDFVASGGQGSDILAAGFGVDVLRKDLGEERSLFETAEQELLKQVDVGFVFTAAWDVGVEVVKKAAVEVGIHATVFQLLDEKHIPFAFDGGIFEGIGDEVVASFKKRCEEIGAMLMNKTEGVTSEKIEQRKLGYGNRAMLLASPFNVPTQTYT